VNLTQKSTPEFVPRRDERPRGMIVTRSLLIGCSLFPTCGTEQVEGVCTIVSSLYDSPEDMNDTLCRNHMGNKLTSDLGIYDITLQINSSSGPLATSLPMVIQVGCREFILDMSPSNSKLFNSQSGLTKCAHPVSFLHSRSVYLHLKIQIRRNAVKVPSKMGDIVRNRLCVHPCIPDPQISLIFFFPEKPSTDPVDGSLARSIDPLTSAGRL